MSTPTTLPTADAPASGPASGAASGTASDTAGFVSLHTHTEFSSQDGLARLKDLVAHVAASGQTAVAQTDHGNIAGSWKFVQACKAAGIKPILGIEAYLALVPEDEAVLDAVDLPAHVERAPEGTPAWLRPEVRFAKHAREGMDAETGKVKRNTNNHLTILVENETGWRNLCRIVNAAEESFYYRPLVDYALLKKHAEGLIILSGCLGGPVASHVAQARSTAPDGTPVWDEARLDEAREGLARLIECAGADNVYVEVMEHGLAAEGRDHIKMLATLAAEAGVEVVATNDSHYVDSCDHEAHDAWVVAGQQQRGSKITVHDTDRWRFNGSGYWMRTEAEMRGLYPKATTWQRAIDNTVAIADRVQGIDEEHPYGVIPFVPLRLPRFPVPADFVEPQTKETYTRSAHYLRVRTLEGAFRRYGVTSGKVSDLPTEVRERIRFEFGVFARLGLEDYPLIVADVIDWARSDRGLPTAEHPLGEPGQKKPILVGPGRGSAAGSLVSYCLNIVMVDPLENGLLFERFLDVERVGMPDVDVDFEAARRDEVYDYLAARYGTEYVARIGAFQNAKTKRAIKDAARVLGLPPAYADTLAKLVPVKQGAPHTFAQMFEEVRDKATGEPVPDPEASAFRAEVARSEDAQNVVRLARAFEGVAAGYGIHAAGVIISDEPLPSLIPMRHLRDKDGRRLGVPVALWDGVDIDAFGMLKLDALGLTNLDIVAAAVDHIARTTGEVIDPDGLPHPDDMTQPNVSAAYELLREGRTQGIFQLASDGITDLIKSVAPTAFSDLSATLALYRPGPMGANMHLMYADRKNGRDSVNYDIYTRDRAEQEVIASVLGDTFGTIVYQEQMMALSHAVADFDAAERNRLRKAVSKKKQSEIDALKAIFMAKGQAATRGDGTAKVAFATSTLETIWVTFNAAAAYLFNKCITGDAVLQTPHQFTWTVEALYHRLYGDDTVAPGTCAHCGERPSTPRTSMCRRCGTWLYKFRDPRRGFSVLAYDFADGRIRPQRVKDVHCNGVKPVLEVTLTDGRSVKVTDNHRLLTPDGWVEAGALHVGDELVADAGYEQTKFTAYRTTVGERRQVRGNKPWLRGERNSGYVDGGFVALREWTEVTRDTAACDECGQTEGRLERAHLDGDRTNNTPENLAWKCVSHHKMWDYRNNNRNRQWDKGHGTEFVAIASIAPAGEQMTYDLEMVEGSDHNFTANGIVSHNSHTVAYGYLSYVTAYLKASWPTQYGAGILSTTEDKKKRPAILKSLAAEGITVDAPDINLSHVHTAPDPTRDHVVRLGLAEIRDVGSNAKWIVEERERNGPYASLADLVERVRVPGQDKEGNPTLAAIGATAVDGLIEAGAFDAFGPRLGHMLIARAVVTGVDLPVPDAEWGALERANRQRVRLGITTGESPLETYAEELAAIDLRRTHDMDTGESLGKAHRMVDDVVTGSGAQGENVTGLLTAWTPKTTRRGTQMANFTLSGATESLDGVVFPQAYAVWSKAGMTPSIGDIVTFTGDVKKKSLTVEKQAQVENEDGEVETVTVESEVETTELIAESVELLKVDNEPRYAAPTAAPVLLRRALRVARQYEALAPAAKPKKAAATSAPAPAPAAPVATLPATEKPAEPAATTPAEPVASAEPTTEPAAEPSRTPVARVHGLAQSTPGYTGTVWLRRGAHHLATSPEQYAVEVKEVDGEDPDATAARLLDDFLCPDGPGEGRQSAMVTALLAAPDPSVDMVFRVSSHCMCAATLEYREQRGTVEEPPPCSGCARSYLYVARTKDRPAIGDHAVAHRSYVPVVDHWERAARHGAKPLYSKQARLLERVEVSLIEPDAVPAPPRPAAGEQAASAG